MTVGRFWTFLAPALLLTACGTSLPRGADFKDSLGIGSTLTPRQVVIGAIVLYYAKDGFTWEVEDRLIGKDTYRLTVKQGKLKEGGAGEARIYFKRRAEEIAGAQGCTGYTTLEYTESLISDYFNVPQRVTEGVIRCDRAATPH
ncbi:MAG: hypothetical protein ACYCZQ_09120 [Burkholderiales bacterium]